MDVRNYCICPTWETVPYYSILVEQTDVPPHRAADLASAIDTELRELNMEYRSKRESGRLGPICVKTVPAGTWYAHDQEAIAARNGRVEQYKHKFLEKEIDFERRFTILATYRPQC